jgi:hypothetical protein
VLLELGLGVSIRLEQGEGRVPEIVEVTELVRHAGEYKRDGAADGLLAVRDDPSDGDRQHLRDLLQKRRQIPLRAAEQGAGEEDFPGETVPHDPQHFVANIRLEAIDGQDHVGLGA